jgi:hypothetical protein
VESDFQTQYKDSNVTRTKNKSASSLSRKKLRKDAVPSQFPNVPAYYSKEAALTRTETATSSSRRERQSKAMEDAASEFLRMDEVSSLAELKEKLDRSCLPSNIIEVARPNQLLFLSIADNTMKKPVVAYSFIVNDSLSFDMW